MCLFIDEIHHLKSGVGEYLLPAVKDFTLNDDRARSRSLRLNLPHFTLVGAVPRQENVPREFLYCFPIIERLDGNRTQGATGLSRLTDSGVQRNRPLEKINPTAEDAMGEPLAI